MDDALATIESPIIIQKYRLALFCYISCQRAACAPENSGSMRLLWVLVKGAARDWMFAEAPPPLSWYNLSLSVLIECNLEMGVARGQWRDTDERLILLITEGCLLAEEAIYLHFISVSLHIRLPIIPCGFLIADSKAALSEDSRARDIGDPADLTLPPEMPILIDHHALKDILGAPKYEIEVKDLGQIAPSANTFFFFFLKC